MHPVPSDLFHAEVDERRRRLSQATTSRHPSARLRRLAAVIALLGLTIGLVVVVSQASSHDNHAWSQACVVGPGAVASVQWMATACS